MMGAHGRSVIERSNPGFSFSGPSTNVKRPTLGPHTVTTSPLKIIAPQVSPKWQIAVVKFFNNDRDFGFVIINADSPEERKEVHLSGDVIDAAGIHDLRSGDEVEIKVIEGTRGLRASAIRFID